MINIKDNIGLLVEAKIININNSIDVGICTEITEFAHAYNIIFTRYRSIERSIKTLQDDKNDAISNQAEVKRINPAKEAKRSEEYLGKHNENKMYLSLLDELNQKIAERKFKIHEQTKINRIKYIINGKADESKDKVLIDLENSKNELLSKIASFNEEFFLNEVANNIAIRRDESLKNLTESIENIDQEIKLTKERMLKVENELNDCKTKFVMAAYIVRYVFNNGLDNILDQKEIDKSLSEFREFIQLWNSL